MELVLVHLEIVVLDIKRSGLFDKNLSEVGINAPVSFLIGICKCRLGNRLADTGVIQLAGECIQAVFNIAETLPASKLSKTRDKKVLPASKLPYTVVALVFINAFLELVFWHKLEKTDKVTPPRQNCLTTLGQTDWSTAPNLLG